MTVTIAKNINGQPSAVLRRRLTKISQQILEELSLTGHHFNILVTDDPGIQTFNRKYRQQDKPTNVLSFPFADGSETDLSTLPIYELGDIVISVETARREAESLHQSLIQRFSKLLIHGTLHLLGFDHEKSVDDAARMLDLEESLFRKIMHKRSTPMVQLAINVDHVATIRQARGVSEPDPVAAAAICEIAGASGIVVHLREDRRHIQDKDVYLLRKTVKTKLNLEMGANRQIIDVALDVVPDMITLVPEKREELTTEGGLDVISQKKKLAKVVKKFNKANIPVSMFIDPDSEQVQASYDVGARYVEIHTGRYCDAVSGSSIDKEFELIANAADDACQLGLIVHGGHGLTYRNTGRIAALETISELSIGHAIISRAVFCGLETAVRDMLDTLKNGRLQSY